jgi:hypothetical protein
MRSTNFVNPSGLNTTEAMASPDKFLVESSRRGLPHPRTLGVYWHSKRHGDLSRVHDPSIGGLLIETPEAIPVGEKIELNFLAQEGHIRAQAVVRHLEPGFGLGLKFTSIRAEDRPRLAALLTRIRAASQRQDQSKQAD